MKKLFGIIAIAAVTAAAGWNFSQNQNEVELSDLVLANVEALARYEDDYCPNGCLDESGDGCWCYRQYPYVREASH